MTVSVIINWVMSILGVIFLAYVWREKNKVYIGVRDKNNKIHKVPVYATDSEETVKKKVDKYLKNIQK